MGSGLVSMTKEEYIRNWGKTSYLIMLEQNKVRNRANRGYKGDNRGSWDRGVVEEILGLPKKRAKLLNNSEEDL